MGYIVDPRNNAKRDSHLLLFEGFMSNCTLAIKKGKEPFVRPGRFKLVQAMQVDTSRQDPASLSSQSPFGKKQKKTKKDEVVFHLQSLEESVNPNASKLVSIYCSSDRSRGYWYDIDNSQKYVGEHFQKKTFAYIPEHLSVADIKRTLRNYFSIKTEAEIELQAVSAGKTSESSGLKDNSNLFDKQCSVKNVTDLDLKKNQH